MVGMQIITAPIAATRPTSEGRQPTSPIVDLAPHPVLDKNHRNAHTQAPKARITNPNLRFSVFLA
jgi:hypothetical protein